MAHFRKFFQKKFFTKKFKNSFIFQKFHLKIIVLSQKRLKSLETIKDVPILSIFPQISKFRKVKQTWVTYPVLVSWLKLKKAGLLRSGSGSVLFCPKGSGSVISYSFIFGGVLFRDGFNGGAPNNFQFLANAPPPVFGFSSSCAPNAPQYFRYWGRHAPQP